MSSSFNKDIFDEKEEEEDKEEEEEENPDEEDQDDDERPIVLSSIWDDKMISKFFGKEDSRKKWKCLWCKSVFTTWNGTKALQHVRKVRKTDVKPCTARIDERHKTAYDALFEKQQKRRKSMCNAKESVVESIASHNVSVASHLDRKRRRIPECVDLSQQDNEVHVTPAIASRSSIGGMQLTLSCGGGATAESHLTMAIADLIHSRGLPFSLASDAKFRNVLMLARNVSLKYQPPGRNQVSTNLLDMNYDAYMEKNMCLLEKEADIYGVAFFGDGATIQKMPFLNILCSGVHIPAACLEIVDCTKHLEAGSKKDAKYIANLFLPFIDKFEQKIPNTVDLALFDGAANVQKAGEVLAALYPRISVLHGAEHVMSLFFSDLFKQPELKVCIDICRQLYKVFGSGAMHTPYAVFSKKAKELNNNRKIGLIRASDTRMGGHVIAIMRLLRLEDAARATVATTEFNNYKVSEQCCSDFNS